MLNVLLFHPTVWLVIGTVLLLLELFEGGFFIFFPSGLGAWMNAAILKLQVHGLFLDQWVFESWEEVITSFAILTVFSMLIIRLIINIKFRKKSSNSDDINIYGS